jgi:hypothetical protein
MCNYPRLTVQGFLRSKCNAKDSLFSGCFIEGLFLGYKVHQNKIRVFGMNNKQRPPPFVKTIIIYDSPTSFVETWGYHNHRPGENKIRDRKPKGRVRG